MIVSGRYVVTLSLGNLLWIPVLALHVNGTKLSPCVRRVTATPPHKPLGSRQDNAYQIWVRVGPPPHHSHWGEVPNLELDGDKNKLTKKRNIAAQEHEQRS